MHLLHLLMTNIFIFSKLEVKILKLVHELEKGTT